jgi:hypothetical protein
MFVRMSEEVASFPAAATEIERIIGSDGGLR